MKPIEPGCLAITYNCKLPENNGRVVKVIRYVGHAADNEGNKMRHVDLWLTDTTFRTTGYTMSPCVSASRLIRIDGYDPTEEETKQEQEVTA